MSADGRRSPRLVCALAGVVACAALVAPVRPLRTAWAASVSARASAAAAEDRYAAAVRVATAVDDSLVALVAARRARDSVGARPYLVISVADHRLWLRAGDTLRFEAPVATGTGDAVEGAARFATPRGRLVVLRKEDDPLWVPPDWHFEEFAADRGLRLARLDPRRPFRSAAGTLEVVGRDVVLLRPDGSRAPLPPGREIVVGRTVVIPPFGTRQRVFRDVLGPHRLSLGQGYGIHGTNEPSSVGRFASHGCIRMRNADIEALVPLVPVGTPVYIY